MTIEIKVPDIGDFDGVEIIEVLGPPQDLAPINVSGHQAATQ